MLVEALFVDFFFFLIERVDDESVDDDLLSAHNFFIHHCLRQGNQCADHLAKLGASSNEECLFHATPPQELLDLIRFDAIGTLFPRA